LASHSLPALGSPFKYSFALLELQSIDAFLSTKPPDCDNMASYSRYPRWQRRAPPERQRESFLPELPLGKLISVIQKDELVRGYEEFVSTARISDWKYLASYNWGIPKPLIVVPGESSHTHTALDKISLAFKPN
jgi:hypothetical protein